MLVPLPPLAVFSRLDKTLEKVFLHHLLDVLSSSAPEDLLALQFVALLVAGEGGVCGVVAEGGAWAAAGLAVEHLAEQVEEGQKLLHAADHVQGQHQVTWLPGQGPGGAVFLWVFLWEEERVNYSEKNPRVGGQYSVNEMSYRGVH